MRSALIATCALVLAANLACTGKKDAPGVVGNQYPHEALDVTGSPYQATSDLENRAGVARDRQIVRGPSLEPKPNTAAVQTQGGVQTDADKGSTQGGTTK